MFRGMFQQRLHAGAASLGCASLLTGPWSSASLGEGEEEERFGFESPEFISGCSDVRLWEQS